VAIGTFDGVHVGHVAVLGAARHEARRRGATAVAYTFDASPRSILGGEAAHLLLPAHAKHTLLEQHVDRVVEVPFLSLRDLSPEAFVQMELVEKLDAIAIVVGRSFRFGRDRSGDLTALQRVTGDRSLDAIAVDLAEMGGEPITSTRIRELLRRGAVDEAACLLARPPALLGPVVRGDGLGRRLGFPTANLSIDPAVLLPADGVYSAWAFCGALATAALAYIGIRPTLGTSSRRCEIHLLTAPDEDLTGSTMEVHLHRRLRGDRTFASLDALRCGIAADVASVAASAPLARDHAYFVG